ncbi:hypothetical protein TNCV_1692321 [Trichonephila clavipes]|nr:hypothetical protein TNCV_1692321 [Trichonephila clavipes]
MLNDDEVVTSVQAESDPVDNEMDEDEDNNNESSKGPSNAGAFSALETAMEYQVTKTTPIQTERSPNFNTTHLEDFQPLHIKRASALYMVSLQRHQN